MHRLEGMLKDRATIVIKIGTNLLTDRIDGLNRNRIAGIARDVSRFLDQGYRVALVSSGAIGAGVAALRLKKKPRSIPEKQATAAIGQPILMEAYESAFRKQGRAVAQILLTKDDFVNRTRYLNARNTMHVLFEKGVVPVINENDSVAVDEIKLGDNDNLSALVANLIGANLLIILSDVDGLYSDDPTRNPSAELIPVVERLSTGIERLAKESSGDLGTGGMITKIQAARRCAASGIGMIITNGGNPRALREVMSGNFRGTLFLPAGTTLNVRKKWIGFVANVKGAVLVDDGAKNALLSKHTSLLPSGIVDIVGEFRANDTVVVRSIEGREIARGVVNYASADLQKIRGRKSNEIAGVLGKKAHDEVIHKDNLVITAQST
jgi:glutamate 5-kinase